MKIEDYWIDTGIFWVEGELKNNRKFNCFFALPKIFEKEEAIKYLLLKQAEILTITSIDEYGDSLLLK